MPAHTININGIEVPEPERKELNDGDEYWCALIIDDDSTSVRYVWDSDSLDRTSLSRGLIHRTREAAEIHAKALLSFTEAAI
jgi:hypothetical protein